VEEFSAIIGFPLYFPPALSNMPWAHSLLCGPIFGLGREDVSMIFFEDEVDFVVLMSYLQKIRHTMDKLYRYKGTLLCLSRAFLFVGGSTKMGSAILFECSARVTS